MNSIQCYFKRQYITTEELMDPKEKDPGRQMYHKVTRAHNTATRVSDIPIPGEGNKPSTKFRRTITEPNGNYTVQTHEHY